MASPLPNTNAPALVKNQAICHSRCPISSADSGVAANSGNARDSAEPLPLSQRGGAFASHVTSPATMNRGTNSDSVTMVTAALTKQINQSSQSLASDFCISL